MPAKDKKILLIDDDMLSIRTVSQLLLISGYGVEVADSGAEGVRKAVNDKFDLVICDIKMPGMDGVQCISAIRENMKQTGEEMQFMFITGYPDEAMPDTVSLGVRDTLLKPLNMNEFLEAVERNLAPAKLAAETGDEGSKRWRFPGREFTYEKLVDLKQTSLEGHIYFADYFAWQGEVREAMLTSHPDYKAERKKNSNIAMKTESSYQRFAHETFLGDKVFITVTSREIKKGGLVLVFRFHDKANGVFLAEGWQKLGFRDITTGEAADIPGYILDIVLSIRQDASSDTNLSA